MVDEGELRRLRDALAPRYRVVRELGHGGAARVYLAHEPKHERDVAIKVLDPEIAASRGTARFLREIRTTAQLSHPHILPLLDSGEVEGVPFYVMPFVEEGSLRERLAREGQLELSEVLRLASEIASALETAHARGIVHRDIKPANVLLEEGKAVVADFGVVRALTRMTDAEQTTKGVALGTPTYMSPEQASGHQRVDGRTDVYALGCLVYEALVGEPPFTGSTSQIVFAKKVTVEPVRPSKCRTGLPSPIDAVIMRALAPSPVDRFETPTRFAEALSEAASGGATVGLRGMLRWGIAGFMFLGLLGWWLAPWLTSEDSAPDPTRWVLFPFEYAGLEQDLNETVQLRDAIARWSGVSVEDPLLVRERLEERDSPPTAAAAAEIARDLGAGRFVRGSVSLVHDSVRVHGVLYSSVGDGRPLYDRVVRLSPDFSSVSPTFDVLADELLFQGKLPDPGATPRATRSVEARLAFLRGQDALRAWNLAAADSAFAEATVRDPEFGAAHLWLALTRHWNGRPASEWTVAIHQAELRTGELSARERRITEALAAEGERNLAAACPIWETLAHADSEDYVAWYSLAGCLADDRAVMRDPASPSGWSFRTSYHAAVEAYRRAFRLHPPILSSFREDSYEDLTAVLKASGNQRRSGRSVGPEPARFAADPAWRGDSLAFVPWPVRTARDRLTVEASEFQLALRHTRETFRDIALAWTTEEPRNADARVALALALTMLGDRSGLDTLRTARRLTTGTAQRLDVMVLEVWIQLALALPSDLEGVRDAKALADSLLSGSRGESGDPGLMAGLAALTGRGHRAASLAADPRATEDVFAPALRRSGPRLMTYAALGRPIDSIAALEHRVWSIVRNELAPDERPRALSEWLGRAASLAFPTYRFRTLDSLTNRGDWLIDAQAALARGDTASVRQAFVGMAGERQAVPPANLTWDGLLPEAWLLHELGETEAVAGWIDPALETLPRASLSLLVTPERAAPLVRAMALRSRLALAMGDPSTARSWARAVLVLWDDADPFLQPVVSELRAVIEATRLTEQLRPDSNRRTHP